MFGVRERKEIRIWGFWASTVGWMVLSVTEMEVEGRNKFSEGWGLDKITLVYEILWKEGDKQSKHRGNLILPFMWRAMEKRKINIWGNYKLFLRKQRRRKERRS